MKFLKLRLLIAVILIAGGIYAITSLRDRASAIVTPPASAAQISAQASPQPAKPAAISGSPISISIPNLNINLPVIPGVYNAKTGQWTLTNDKVQYAVMTPEPNTTGGNTFLYGHYRKGVFSTLHNIAPNSEASITTDNGHVFTYKLISIQTVSPEDSAAVFAYQGAPILTIQTCTGLFFQNRQLFTFSLEKVS